MLVVDPWDWLEDDGSLPSVTSPDRRRALRVARLIEYGGPLAPGQTRETLVECSRRPGGYSCTGLLWVVKGDDHSIYAFCPMCHRDEVTIQNWQATEWAHGPMIPVLPGVPEFPN